MKKAPDKTKISHRTTMKKRNADKWKMTGGKWALLGIVLASTLVIIIALCSQLAPGPVERAEKELKRLADDYYVLFLYPRLVGFDRSPQEALEVYVESGVPTTYLRQLLHYNDDENIGSAGIFEDLKCDTNGTGVRYFPVEPYGPKDYTVNYIWRCEAPVDSKD